MKITKNKVEFEVTNEPEWFWKMMQDGSWEPETYMILDKYLKADREWFDIGAWVGPVALYGALISKKCYAFEPDPVAARVFRANIALNKIENIEFYESAVSDKDGRMEIGACNEYGDSMSSSLWKKSVIEVDAISLDRMGRTHNPNFIKMDIEGGEYRLLQMTKPYFEEFKPTLYLSLHTPWMNNNENSKEMYFDVVCDILALYDFIYDCRGNKITVDDVRNLVGFTSVVATNETSQES